jgi:hypothetical protein
MGAGLGEATGLGLGEATGEGDGAGVGAPLTVSAVPDSPPPQAVRPPASVRQVAIHKVRTCAVLIWSIGSFFWVAAGMAAKIGGGVSGTGKQFSLL